MAFSLKSALDTSAQHASFSPLFYSASASGRSG